MSSSSVVRLGAAYMWYTVLALGLTAAAAPVELSAQGDETLDQVEAMADRGDSLAARELLTSWERDRAGTARPADVARSWYLRARLTEESSQAEILYLKVIIEGSTSSYADDALLRLAQYAYAAGDYTKSIDYLGQLRRDYPTSELGAEALLWLARNAHSQGNAEGACSAVDQGLKEVLPTDTNLVHALESARATCGGAQGRYSVQVAALKDNVAAQQLARDLIQAGYDAWILNATSQDPYYRIRIGRGLDEASAERILDSLEEAGYSPFLVAEGGAD